MLTWKIGQHMLKRGNILFGVDFVIRRIDTQHANGTIALYKITQRVDERMSLRFGLTEQPDKDSLLAFGKQGDQLFGG